MLPRQKTNEDSAIILGGDIVVVPPDHHHWATRQKACIWSKMSTAEVDSSANTVPVPKAIFVVIYRRGLPVRSGDKY